MESASSENQVWQSCEEMSALLYCPKPSHGTWKASCNSVQNIKRFKSDLLLRLNTTYGCINAKCVASINQKTHSKKKLLREIKYEGQKWSFVLSGHINV